MITYISRKNSFFRVSSLFGIFFSVQLYSRDYNAAFPGFTIYECYSSKFWDSILTGAPQNHVKALACSIVFGRLSIEYRDMLSVSGLLANADVDVIKEVCQ